MMNPADSRSLQEELLAQASALQHCNQRLTSMTEGLQQREDHHERRMTSIQEQLQKLTLSMQAEAPRPPFHSPPASDARLPPPERYSGAPGSCRPFLVQCSLAFELQPSAFPTERSRVAFVVSLLTGRAKDWGTAEWHRQSTICSSVELFSAGLRRVFDHVTPGREAARGLFNPEAGREVRGRLLHRVPYHGGGEQLECCFIV